MLSAAYSDQILKVPFKWIDYINEQKYQATVIIQLMFPLYLGPKVIILSGFNFILFAQNYFNCWPSSK